MSVSPQECALFDELICLTPHCVYRFRERARPDLRLGPARQELRLRAISEGTLADTAPAWLQEGEDPADGHLLIGDELCLPLRAHDPRGGRRLVALTCLQRSYRRASAVPSPRAQAWARRRAHARQLRGLIVFSQTAIRRYCQRRQPSVSGHADLVAAARAGELCPHPPTWAWRLPRRDVTSHYLDCGDFWLPLGLYGEGEHARLIALNCLWADWKPTERQRGTDV